MLLCDLLEIPRGVTALVGGGGKTTLLRRLAAELSARGRVLCLTTTHMYPPQGGYVRSPAPEELARAFSRVHAITIGEPTDGGKLGRPLGNLQALLATADYALIEADGSHGLPLKAPAEHEPALPGDEALVIALAGASGIGKLIEEAAHRPALYAALLHKRQTDPVTPEDAAFVLQHEHGQRKNVRKRFMVVLNQCESESALEAARQCAARLHDPCALVALRESPNFYELWRNGTCSCSSREREI
ncbi:MAG: selenium cofactor biosynthesis protein YqeC [Clostridia bacterium]